MANSLLKTQAKNVESFKRKLVEKNTKKTPVATSTDKPLTVTVTKNKVTILDPKIRAKFNGHYIDIIQLEDGKAALMLIPRERMLQQIAASGKSETITRKNIKTGETKQYDNTLASVGRTFNAKSKGFSKKEVIIAFAAVYDFEVKEAGKTTAVFKILDPVTVEQKYRTGVILSEKTIERKDGTSYIHHVYEYENAEMTAFPLEFVELKKSKIAHAKDEIEELVEDLNDSEFEEDDMDDEEFDDLDNEDEDEE